jgi:predicted permease
MNNIQLDIRTALRSLRKSPGFTTVAVLSLALGIGANTAIFSLLDQALWRQLAVRNPGELVLLHLPVGPSGSTTADSSETSFSHPVYLNLRGPDAPWQALIARNQTSVAIGYQGRSERVRAELVSGNFFETLGVKPYLGRLIGPSDDVNWEAHPLVVAGYDYWKTKLGGDPNAVGRTVHINSQPMTLIGVAEPGFRSIVSGQTPELYLPVVMQPALSKAVSAKNNHRYMFLTLMARLRPGMSAKQAEAAIQPLTQRILQEELKLMNGSPNGTFGKRFLGQALTLRPAGSGVSNLQDELRRPLTMLMVTVGLVLLLACLNLANLLLVRASSRRREIAVRLSLGATRWSLFRLLWVESFLLAVAGGVCGIVLSGWITELLLKLLPDATSGGWMGASLDGRVLLFTAGLTIVTSAIFGSLPAWGAARQDLTHSLKDQGRGAGEGREHSRWRAVLVTGQVALAFLLLAGAGLFARSLSHLFTNDPGFRAEQVLRFSVAAPLRGYSLEAGRAFYNELQRRLAALPGVRSAAAASVAVLENSSRNTSLSVEGYQAAENEDTDVGINTLTPGYFATLGTPLRQGREFTANDDERAPKVAIVNEALVRRYRLRGNILGRRLSFMSGNASKLEIAIVGVVADSRHNSIRDKIIPYVYIPYLQEKQLPALTFYVRTNGDPTALMNAARAAVSEMDQLMPIYRTGTMEDAVTQSLASERMVTVMTGSFGLLALLLACLGIYGVIAYSVARRTPEIGLRLALGGMPRDVVWMVFRDVAVMLSVGLACGFGAALALGRYAASELEGVTAHDPLALGAAALVLSLAALLAAAGPARIAARVDPMRALRYE